ncbi:MAG: molybdopterin converting factor subunit 1 [Planctomycetota bacterium]|nr:molybdopterin converting factor subunit 1 [Planctomycetota bacterium]
MREEQIEVNVLFFARAHELAGTSRDTMVLRRGATVAEAQDALGRKFPRLAGLLERSRIAVDEEFASPSRTIDDGAVLAVIPPVSGG